MEFEENNQTQDASFPEKPNETPAQDMPGAEAEESSRQAGTRKSICLHNWIAMLEPTFSVA